MMNNVLDFFILSLVIGVIFSVLFTQIHQLTPRYSILLCIFWPSVAIAGLCLVAYRLIKSIIDNKW